jgi:hypothetical protein
MDLHIALPVGREAAVRQSHGWHSGTLQRTIVEEKKDLRHRIGTVQLPATFRSRINSFVSDRDIFSPSRRGLTVHVQVTSSTSRADLKPPAPDEEAGKYWVLHVPVVILPVT